MPKHIPSHTINSPERLAKSGLKPGDRVTINFIGAPGPHKAKLSSDSDNRILKVITQFGNLSVPWREIIQCDPA